MGLDFYSPVRDSEVGSKNVIYTLYIVAIFLEKSPKANDGGSYFQYDGDSSLFEDEDTRQFYETLPDLKSLIPGVSRTKSAAWPTKAALSEQQCIQHRAVRWTRVFLTKPHAVQCLAASGVMLECGTLGVR